jgi:hypothetical protein
MSFDPFGSNPPGRSTLQYRVGDYLSVRRALLHPLADDSGNPRETSLRDWRPGTDADLAVQMVEWWAYLADILAFYNERHIHAAFLRTASSDATVARLIRLLGYRPRPGVGAWGTLAGIVTGNKPITLPRGFQITSKPGPGDVPQTFEVDQDTVLLPFSKITTSPMNEALFHNGNGGGVLLRGVVTNIAVDETLLLMPNGYSPVLVKVKSIVQEKDGTTNTRITFYDAPNVPNATAALSKLMRHTQTSKLYPHKSDHVLMSSHLHLDSVRRDVNEGDLVVLESLKNAFTKRLLTVTAYSEVLWYSNAASESRPDLPPNPDTNPPIPAPHTRLDFSPAIGIVASGTLDVQRSSLVMRYGWVEVGKLLGKQTDSVSGTVYLTDQPASPFKAGTLKDVLLKDANGEGRTAQGGHSSAPYINDFEGTLRTPLTVYLNLIPVSRGKTVPSEILGSGDASQANQRFTLKKSPLTYLLGADGSTKSTLRLWVNNVEWREVPNFLDQPPDAPVFVTQEDDERKTHVLFGDGINGARLPTGRNNITAMYRYESGADAPDADTLNVIAKPMPGLQSIRNPVAVGGGADPDDKEHIRTHAPRSVLTFGRAISADDYQVIAAQAPGVARARAYWRWSAEQQRALVTVYVGDDAGAVQSATLALRGAYDPNRAVSVQMATPIRLALMLSVLVDPRYGAGDVLAGVHAALIHAEHGLFGTQRVRIGYPVFESEIHAASLSVPGALAVHGLAVRVDRGSGFVTESSTAYRYLPGTGAYFVLDSDDLLIAQA